MSNVPRGFKWGSIVTSSLIAIGVIALAGSIMLPSTKRARIDLDSLRETQHESQAEPTTGPSVGAAQGSATAP